MAGACAAHRSARRRSCTGQAPLYGHNSADDAAFDARVRRDPERRTAPCECNGRARSRAGPRRWARPWSSGCARCSMPIRGRPIGQSRSGARSTRETCGMNGSANLLGAEALADAPSPPAEINDVADDAGGGATRNAQALSTCRGTSWSTISFLTSRCAHRRCVGCRCLPTSSPSSRSWTARQSAGEDPVAYRLSVSADHHRPVIKTATEMADSFGTTAAHDGRARGFGFAPLQEPRRLAAVVAEVEVDEQVVLHPRVGGRRRGPRDQSGWRGEPDRGRNHPGGELDPQRGRALRGSAGPFR